MSLNRISLTFLAALLSFVFSFSFSSTSAWPSNENQKRWPSFVKNSAESFSNAFNRLHLPLRFAMAMKNEDEILRDLEAKVSTIEQAFEGLRSQATSDGQLAATVARLETSISELRGLVRYQGEEIAELRDQMLTSGVSAKFSNSNAVSDDSERPDSHFLAKYKKRNMCAYNDSGLVLAMTIDKQITAGLCARQCDKMDACIGFQHFSGLSNAQNGGEGCFYLRGPLNGSSFRCYRNSEEARAENLPNSFAIYLKQRRIHPAPAISNTTAA